MYCMTPEVNAPSANARLTKFRGFCLFTSDVLVFFFIVDREISVFCTNLWSIHYIYTKKATKVGANHSVWRWLSVKWNRRLLMCLLRSRNSQEWRSERREAPLPRSKASMTSHPRRWHLKNQSTQTSACRLSVGVWRHEPQMTSMAMSRSDVKTSRSTTTAQTIVTWTEVMLKQSCSRDRHLLQDMKS